MFISIQDNDNNGTELAEYNVSIFKGNRSYAVERGINDLQDKNLKLNSCKPFIFNNGFT